MSVAILVPMWGRPHRVRPVHDSAISATPHARVVFIVSPDDPDVTTQCRELFLEHLDDATCCVLTTRWPGGVVGDYARKINFGYHATYEELLFLGADDLAFHHGWFEAACAHLSDTIHVVGTQDLGNARVIAGEHATHSLVTRAYVDKFGTIDEPRKILHEGYPHEYVDDEFIGTAKKRGAYAFANDSIVEHLHAHYGKAPTDALYEAQTERMRQGRPLYDRRRRLWTSPSSSGPSAT